MVKISPTVIKELYNEWNIHGFVLLSLCLQIILILLAPFRKHSRNPIIIGLIWSAYLLADSTANFAVGLISRRQNYYPKLDDDRVDILAFWAPFLLLHLGGPDTISAFSMEDNALWLRHLVGLITQVLAAIVVFGQSLPRNKLWISTVFLFVAGTIKYGERTYALYSANLDTFQESVLEDPDPGPNYAKLMEEYASENEEDDIIIPEPNEEWEALSDKTEKDNLDDVDVVKNAYQYFDAFKGLIANAIFSVSERDQSRQFFLRRSPKDAFEVLEVELNFIYEVFYTKIVVVYSKLGCVIRFISWCAIMTAFSTFYSIDKHDFHEVDVRITYILLFGAIGLDAIALFMLAVSDWNVANIEKFSRGSNLKAAICNRFLDLLKYFLTLKRSVWLIGMLFQRWSGSLYTYNLINCCLKERPKRNRTILDHFTKLISIIGPLKHICDRHKHVFKKPSFEDLWKFIFNKMKDKPHLSDDPNFGRGILLAQHDLILKDSNLNTLNGTLMSFASGVNYDRSLLMWHIATDLCYERDKVNSNDDDFHISKILSDYMLYLLVLQPAFMSSIAGIGKIRFRDTCAEAKVFFSENVPDGKSEEEEREVASKVILLVNTNVKPVTLKGDKSKSVLFDACILAKELQTLDSQLRWKLISKVWVELLCYAAGHCRSDMHVAQLSKGGEFITFVWLLMAHLGLGDNFQSYMGTAASVAANILQPPNP